jgi:hypothetical protein
MGEQVTGPTVREFDLLKDGVAALGRRISDIDNNGTRGVQSIQVQMTEIVKDISELKVDVNNLKVEVKQDVSNLKDSVDRRFLAHGESHIQEAKDRVKGRRWVIGTMIAAVLALCAVITLLVYLIQAVGAHVSGG